MTNKEAISNLEELYPVVSEEKKQAIDKAIKALKLTDKNEKEGEQTGTPNLYRSCNNCKHKSFDSYENLIFCELRSYPVSKDDYCFHFWEASHD